MREFVDFRVPEDAVKTYLPSANGTSLGGTVRKIVVAKGSPLFWEIGKVEQQQRAEGRSFFLGAYTRRVYPRLELEQAELFHVWPRPMFEPAGEECGTVYDETAACDHVFEPESEIVISGHRIPMSVSTCGVGARQTTPLHLDTRRIPRRVDFARTIAGEIVASARARDVFSEWGLLGAEFDPVRQANAGGMPSTKFFQLNIVGPPVELAAATRAGSDPFDETGFGRCPLGHVAGLNLLSEVHVQQQSVGRFDAMVTRQMVGVRRGLLRPRPILLLSPKAWRAVEGAKLKGLVVEIARLS